MAEPTQTDFAEPTASVFRQGAGGFSVDQASYPEDLMGEDSAYGNNAAIFYISVQNDSTLFTNSPKADLDAGSVDKKMGSRLEGANVSDGQASALAVGTGAAAAATGGLVLGGFGKVGAVLGGAFGANAAFKVGNAKRTTKTLQQAIALHMPANLSTTYGMNWDAQDTGLLGVGVSAVEAYNNSSGVMSGLANGASAIASSLAGKALDMTPAGSRLAATAHNPKKEQIFQGVEFRTFNFDYSFWPRSVGEAQAVRTIIKLFKLHMHPEFLTADQFLYLYPSEFDIRYYTKVGTGRSAPWVENLNIHRHTSCVLTNMTLTYAPQGVYSSLTDGMPTQINMQLQFKELALLTKENIQNGY